VQNDLRADMPLGSSDLQAIVDQSFPELAERTLTVKLVSNAESRELNDTYRSIDKETNVLSFAYEPMFAHDDSNHLGDLAIACDVVLQEANAQHKSYRDHFVHLVIHGVLHLTGFDHEDPNDAKIMESREVELLAEIGISDPY